MRYYYICDDCLKEAADGDVKSLNVDEYNYICGELTFEVEHSSSDVISLKCELCGGSNIRKLMTPPTTYVRGDGYKDKIGAKRDRDLHLMLSNDPYASSRKPGDKLDIINKLRRGKEHNKRAKTIKL